MTVTGSDAGLTRNTDAYLLITPAKNEEENLSGLIESILNQSNTPALWLIIDDGSTDQTGNIIRFAERKYPWITGLLLPSSSGQYDIEEHYAEVCSRGFEEILSQAKARQLPFQYIGLSDADTRYPRDYFYDLIEFFRKYHDYGIVSGAIAIQEKSGKTYPESKIFPGADLPLGTGRLWRMQTFQETGGYPRVRAPDAVSNILAHFHGWKTARLPDVVCYQTRPTGGKFNLWQGYTKRGQRAYYLNANILSVGNTIFDMICISRQRDALTKSFAFLFGYFRDYSHCEEQIPLGEIRGYFGSYKRVFHTYLEMIKKL